MSCHCHDKGTRVSGGNNDETSILKCAIEKGLSLLFVSLYCKNADS